MSTQHTPGPWEAKFWDIGNRSKEWHITDGTDPICNSPVGPQAFNEANARLIAAAPALLEALEYANELLTANRHRFPKSIQHRDRFALENTIAAFGKAIAAAREEN